MNGDSAKDALEHWLAHLPETRPAMRLDVSFKNLQVYGFKSPTDYQTTVGSYILALGVIVRRLLGLHKRQKVGILRNLDGLVLSGEMLLVLGKPGSGCSTFLKALAGDTHGFHIDPQSQVNYKGISFNDLHGRCKGAAIYQAELDVHFPELTLGETLSFAAAALARQGQAGSHSDTKSLSPSELVATIFEINSSIGTKMGDETIRGVSGGEKKRTSIAEAFMAGAPIQSWDNTTRGLDSSTALQVITTIKRMTRVTGSSVMVSVYQASQATYDQFDKVLLLYEGRQVYFGPIDHAVPYMESLGFLKSDRETTADFLTSLTNPSERVHAIKPGYEDQVPRSPDEFAAAWNTSTPRRALLEEIVAYNAKHPIERGAVDSRAVLIFYSIVINAGISAFEVGFIITFTSQRESFIFERSSVS
ncbi:hypothetical protein O1611_g2522 [Lasiodiplodia mahajangana]|uniref:Uncharacterized protein n=1 Tax=Lasiodiplodia mahajangana TaxID=1108764 RepID=A0ACC2JU92_9PEZI|nr:hypothetical protein O1611_g2522 [Lasiodiplodia mahajangana]